MGCVTHESCQESCDLNTTHLCVCVKFHNSNLIHGSANQPAGQANPSVVESPPPFSLLLWLAPRLPELIFVSTPFSQLRLLQLHILPFSQLCWESKPHLWQSITVSGSLTFLRPQNSWKSIPASTRSLQLCCSEREREGEYTRGRDKSSKCLQLPLSASIN